MKQKLVSIIMPAFNAGKTIKKSIESVFKQSYIDWELIVIDDASTDNTKEIVESLIKKEKRIVLLANKKNIGCALAWACQPLNRMWRSGQQAANECLSAECGL